MLVELDTKHFRLNEENKSVTVHNTSLDVVLSIR